MSHRAMSHRAMSHRGTSHRAAFARLVKSFISATLSPPLVRRFVAQSEAGTTVEFALLAAPFMAALFAILQTALIFFAGQTLEAAAASSARLILTGQAQTAGWTAAQFKQQVCNQIHGIFNCSNGIYVDVETYPSFAAANLGLPIVNGIFNTAALAYNPGGPGDIVMLRLYYQYPVFVNLLSFNLSNLSGGYNLFAATAVFKNEPYAAS
ncbi:MAG TPA: TadE/TadG family type IV pilus assembly protein [Xanthobacteraceae bacterium]|nr:TadE/TadG family type IV pilus assembly protein [Xanthobacteraceae bacterium]